MPLNPLLDSLVILGLDETATWKEIKEARRDLSQIWHTDRFHNMNQLNERDFPLNITAPFSFKEEQRKEAEAIARRPVKKYLDPSSSVRFAKYSFALALIIGFLSIPQSITAGPKDHFRFITPPLSASRSPMLTGGSIISYQAPLT
jgi:hypothetical protein